MPTVDELLGDATGIEPAYLNDDIQYVIDENLRTVTIPEDGVVLGVKGDKDTNRVNFQMMRYYNGFDLSEFKFRVNYENANGGLNFYDVTDATVYEDVIYFTWLVDAFAAAYVGDVNFSVRLYKTEGTKVTQNFYTTHNSAKVLEGILSDEELDENNIEDLIEHLKRVMEEYGYEIAGPIISAYLLDNKLNTDVTEEIVRRLLTDEYFPKMAYVKHTGANEFEYDESKLEAKVRAYTYSRDEIETKITNVSTSLNNYYTKTEIESIRKNLVDNIADVDQRIDTAISSVNTDINRLEEVSDNFQSHFDTVDGNIKTLTQQIATVNDNLTTEIKSLKDRVAALEKVGK